MNYLIILEFGASFSSGFYQFIYMYMVYQKSFLMFMCLHKRILVLLGLDEMNSATQPSSRHVSTISMQFSKMSYICVKDTFIWHVWAGNI